MLFNPHSDKSLLKLRQALTGSLSQLKQYAKLRKEAYTFYVGKHYSEEGKRTPVPMNMIEMAVSIILRSLISSQPQAYVGTSKKEYQPDAYSFELALNRSLDKMDFGKSLKDWSFEALMSPFGILKVALDATDVDQMDDMQMWTGEPMAEPVFFDDWVHDMSANSIEKVGYCGNRYEVFKEEALTSGLYDPEVVERISKIHKENDDSTQSLAGEHDKCEDYRETLELWDIWLPDEGLVVTITRDFEQLPPLRVVEWNGPPSGPYHLLWFNNIPGNTIPLPPVALWRDIHELANKLMNKLGRQALRQKDIVTVPNNAVNDGKKIIYSQDGEGIVTDTPDAVKQVKFGGIDQSNFGYVVQLKQLFSYYGGNLDALGGLAAQSGTVGQDELLGAAASQRIRSMQEEVDKAAAKAIRSIGWFYWDNPILEIPIVKTIAGTDETLNAAWTREKTRGEWYDYDISIVPHSLRQKAPEERLAFVQQFFASLLPALPVLQAQGIAPNVEAYVKMVARLSNMPELNDLVTYLNGEMQPMDTGSAPPPPTKTQRVVKANSSTKTMQGQESQLIQKLMSSGEAA